MRYGVFFAALALLAAYLISLGGPLIWPAVWLLGCALVMTVAYLLNVPVLITGKGPDGRLIAPLAGLTFPWLALTRVTFAVQSALSRENAADAIPGTSWTIGRYPGGDYPAGYDLYIDLTAEFSGPQMPKFGRYCCFPNLDAMALSHLPDIAELIPPSIANRPLPPKVFIHCAQGHGRSATCAAICLSTLYPQQYPSAADALHAIQSVRPGAIPNRAQLAQIAAYDAAHRAPAGSAPKSADPAAGTPESAA